MDTRPSLPVHPLPDAVRQQTHKPALRVDGLVDQTVTLTQPDLAELPRVQITEPFTCEEGWQVEGLTWRGVRLVDVLALAGIRVEARWVRAGAGDYAVPLPLEQADAAILADELNGEPLAVEHGGPLRLVLPGSSCFTSVKWVDRLEVTAEPGKASGERIARARLTPNT